MKEKEGWTIDLLRAKAQELGKSFNPNPEIADRLEKDLEEGALVFFTVEEVETAIAKGLIPQEWKPGLVELVQEKKDIAIIPKDAVEVWRIQRSLFYDIKECGH